MKKQRWTWKYTRDFCRIQFFRAGRAVDTRSNYSPEDATAFCNYLNRRQGIRKPL